MKKRSSPKMMKAAFVTAFGKPLTLGDFPRPVPRFGEVLVKLEACGVCHTDVHATDGDWPVRPRRPFIPGHEGVGRVVELGRGVKAIKEGDRVGLPWLHSTCGHCDFCLTGRETLCEAATYAGYSANGAFAEYCVSPADFVVRVPEAMNPAAVGPILCAGVTTYKGIKVTRCRPGEWLVVSGVGGLGHLAIQYAKAMGLHVAAVDISDTKLELARALGADLTFNAEHEDATASVRAAIGGAHSALVTAVSRPAISQSVAMLRRGGTCVLTGLPPGEFSLSIFDVVLRGLTIQGSLVGTRADMNEALAFAAEGKVRPEIETVPFEQVNEVLQRLRRGTVNGRIVLDPP